MEFMNIESVTVSPKAGALPYRFGKTDPVLAWDEEHQWHVIDENGNVMGYKNFEDAHMAYMDYMHQLSKAQ
jgi:hypothetical protein